MDLQSSVICKDISVTDMFDFKNDNALKEMEKTLCGMNATDIMKEFASSAAMEDLMQQVSDTLYSTFFKFN